MTILFCDLVGFTARSDRADPEDVRAILKPFHALAREEIERYGGTLDKFMGDAAMGVFGSPMIHEDDPERAVRAALAIVQRVGSIDRGRGAPSPGVRVGVNTGEAIVTLASGVQEGENVAGDVVNTASRLQSAAGPGQVVVGEATRRATRDAVRYQELPPVSAKGKAEPVRAWRAVDIRPLPTISDRPAASPFVGRREELSFFERELRQAIEEGSARLVTVVGEAGVGKSRLIAEVRANVPRALPDADVQWRRGRCLPYGDGITFWALGEIVKEHAGILESDAARVRDRKLLALLDRLMGDPAERAWLHARLGPLTGGDAGQPVDRDEAFAAWRRFLEAATTEHPLVAVVEDLHWADPAMVAFLEDLVERAAPIPLFVIATARPELFDRHPAWVDERPGRSLLSLPGLSDAETAALLGTLLHAPSLPASTRGELVERSGGNPLFAEELARTLRERGAIDDAGQLQDGAAARDLPESVQALIAARLDALPLEAKSLLQAASVIGRVFWAGAAASLVAASEAALGEGLEDLARRELIRPVATSSFQGQAEYIFWHALVRDVVYGQIPRAERSDMHHRAAMWIEATAGERSGDLAEILAHHAVSALDLALAAGAEGIEELKADAARHLRLAAVWTMALDVGKAEQQMSRALELTPATHPDRARLLGSLAEAAFQAGSLDQANPRYEEAIAGLRAQGDLVEAADAMVRRSVVLEYLGETATGRTLLGEAIQILSDLPPGPELARALATSSGSFLIAGHYDDAIAQADRAIDLATVVNEPAAAARAHGYRGYARAVHGDPAGVAEQHDALDGLLALGLGRPAAIAYNNLGTCLIHVEGPRPAMELLEEGLVFAESRGLSEAALALRDSMLTALFEAGEWDDLLRRGEEVVAEARRQGSGHDEVFADADRAVVLAYRQGAAARQPAESVLARARPLDDAPLVLQALLAAGIARMASDDRGGAISALEEALEITAGDSVVDRAPALPDLTRVAVAAGDIDLAERLMAGMGDLVLERYQLALTTARAAVAEATGDAEGALAVYEDAAVRWERWGHALERAHALFGAGRCLTRLGRDEEAAPLLQEADSAFARLGAAPSRAELRRVRG